MRNYRLLVEGSDVVHAIPPVRGTPRYRLWFAIEASINGLVRADHTVRDTPSNSIDARDRRGHLTELVSSLDARMKLLEFKDGGRMFVCRAESSPATPGTLWWWISVTGESSRYAAFRAESGDDEARLRPRILAYYEQMLADRARPPIVRQHWAQRRAAQSGGASATSAATPIGASGNPPQD